MRPDANQRRHSNNAYELLRNSFIPGVVVDMQTGNVEAMGAKASLYMNGQPCDVRDLLMLRPRDIDKIEYHDIPTGKYSNDRTAINFVVKQYRYGGYVTAKAQQTIGYGRGIYDLATTLNHGRNTYSVFAGIDNAKVSGNEAISDESFRFDTPLNRHIKQVSDYKRNGQYVQVRHQYQGQKNYLTTKLTLVNSDMPYNRVVGTSDVAYLYYMQQFKNKWTLSAISQYNFSHNNVTTDYTQRGERIVRSFVNDGNTHHFSEIVGLSCRISQWAGIGGDIHLTIASIYCYSI